MNERRIVLSKIIALVVALLSSSLMAQTLPLRQFQHTAWTLQDGAPSQIFALAQTTDGYLWLGTVNGLFRFDGVSFERYRLPHGQQFLHTAIQSLTATKNGQLWIGYTMGDVSVLKDGVLTNLMSGELRATGTIFSIVIATDGTVWAAADNGLIHFFSGEWHDAAEAEGTDIKSAYFLTQDREGTLWVATDLNVYRLVRGSTRFEKTGFLGGSSALVLDGPDGALWMTEGDGFHAYSDRRNTVGTHHDFFAFPDEATDCRFDRTGALWIMGAKTGVTRVPKPHDALNLSAEALSSAKEHFDASNGLTSNRALATLEDREGNIWVATAEGLDRFRVTALEPAPLPATFGFYMVAGQPDGSIVIGTESDGLQKLVAGKIEKVQDVTLKRITSMMRSPDGKLWLGGVGDLGYLESNHFHAVAVPNDFKSPERDTQTMTIGPGGDLWVQTASKLEIERLHDGTWIPVKGSRRGSGGEPLIMTTDHLGRVWAGFMNSVVKIFEDDKMTILDQSKGLVLGNITALYDSGKEMWVGGEHGLDVMIAGKPVAAKFFGDAKIDGVSGIIIMDDGSLWLNSLLGVARVPVEEVNQFRADPSHAMRYRLFNYLDGLAGEAPQVRTFPSIVRGVGSVLWFTTTNGVASIDTANISTNRTIPPVSIKRILIDGKLLDAERSIALPKGSQNLEIDYTALSLSVPERMLFRYWLEGYDKEWQDAGSRRQAFYPHLPPGHYTFHVVACNNDGVWNDTGAVMAIYLPPTFLQSWYFKSFLASGVLAMLWLLYLFRVKRETSRVQARLYERFSERERIARDLHDTFFQGIQGLLLSVQSASRELPEGDSTKSVLEETLIQSDGVMTAGRELVFNLRAHSRNATDLGSALESAAMEFSQHYASEFRLTVVGELRDLSTQVCEELCKLGREALCNAYRHACAQSIEVKIEYRADSLRLAISDDGVGISNETLAEGGRENHWGLPGMRERAANIGATLRVLSSPGSGTIVQVDIPSRLAYPSVARVKIRRLFERFRTTKLEG